MFKKIICFLFFAVFISSCAQKNTDTFKAEVVANFELSKFLGLWYEIANYDGKNDEDNVILEFYADKIGEVSVMKSSNIGEKPQKLQVSNLNFPLGSTVGSFEINKFMLKKTYNIVKIEPNYDYALIFSDDGKELFMLSRTKTMPEIIRYLYSQSAKNNGFDLKKLNWVKQK